MPVNRGEALICRINLCFCEEPHIALLLNKMFANIYIFFTPLNIHLEIFSNVNGIFFNIVKTDLPSLKKFSCKRLPSYNLQAYY